MKESIRNMILGTRHKWFSSYPAHGSGLISVLFEEDYPDAVDALAPQVIVSYLVGLVFKDVQAMLAHIKCKYRVVKEDGRGMMITADVKMERANLVLENGVITEVYYG